MVATDKLSVEIEQLGTLNRDLRRQADDIHSELDRLRHLWASLDRHGWEQRYARAEEHFVRARKALDESERALRNHAAEIQQRREILQIVEANQQSSATPGAPAAMSAAQGAPASGTSMSPTEPGTATPADPGATTPGTSDPTSADFGGAAPGSSSDVPAAVAPAGTGTGTGMAAAGTVMGPEVPGGSGPTEPPSSGAGTGALDGNTPDASAAAAPGASAINDSPTRSDSPVASDRTAGGDSAAGAGSASAAPGTDSSSAAPISGGAEAGATPAASPELWQQSQQELSSALDQSGLGGADVQWQGLDGSALVGTPASGGMPALGTMDALDNTAGTARFPSAAPDGGASMPGLDATAGVGSGTAAPGQDSTGGGTSVPDATGVPVGDTGAPDATGVLAGAAPADGASVAAPPTGVNVVISPSAALPAGQSPFDLGALFPLLKEWEERWSRILGTRISITLGPPDGANGA